MFVSNKIHVQTVSEITGLIKNRLEKEFRFVHVSGEVSNLRCPFSGHLYFSLKDNSAQIKAVLFKGQKRYLENDIEDGQQIICHGRVSVYEPRGEYQLIVDTVDHYGFGNLQAEFEKLKQRLANEGIFDEGLKKVLPPFLQSLVLITSPTGAALFDFLKIANLRHSFTNILIFPVRVQGDGAAEEIASAIDRVNTEIQTDLIVLCRGGGSIEDLWSFNEECVARAIHRSRLPVVTGVGHEIDTTIADYCADYRASTPTGAAEVLLQDGERLHTHIEKLQKYILTSIDSRISDNKFRVKQSERLLGNLDSFFINLSLKLDLQTSRFIQTINSILHTHTKDLQALSSRLHNNLPSAKLKFQEQRLSFTVELLRHYMRGNLEKKSEGLAKQMLLLDSVSPLSTLARGYAVISKKDAATGKDTIIRKSDQVRLGENLNILLHKGRLQCRVTGKEK